MIEIDGASNTGVDDVRELRENVKFAPFHGSYRVYIIDEVHMLSNSAFNALLKILEEPPSHAVFIFATTEVHKIPATILSRCQHFTFRRISRLEIISQLRHVANQTGVTVEDRSLSVLARTSEGSMRDALSLLDQAVSFGGEALQHEDLEALIGSVPDELVRQMIDAILAHEASRAMTLVGEVVDQGFDVRVYCRAILERIRHILVACVVPSQQQVQALLELGEEEGMQVINQAKELTEPYVQAIFSIISRTEDSLRGSSHPRFLIEAAVVRAALWDPKTDIAKETNPNVGVKPQLSRQPKPSLAVAPVGATPSQMSQAPLSPEQPKVFQRAPERGNPSTRDTTSVPPQSISVKDKPIPPQSLSTSNPLPSPKPASVASGQLGTLNWEQLVDRMIKDHPNVGSFLEKGSVVTLEEDHAVIGFSKRDAIARWRTDKPENRTLIAKICEEMAGHPMRIQVIELSDGQTRPPSMAEQRAKKKHEDDQDLMQQAKAHPLIKEALEVFGGELASAQRHPQTEEAT